jgi:metallo-beta-lactamase class B
MIAKVKVHILLLVITVALATGAAGQGAPEPVDVSQSHLAAARALAAEENSWRHPALITCYPNMGAPSQSVNKDPGGYKIFDNLYYVGNGKIGPYAIDTSAGIILIDSMNNRSDVKKIILPNMRMVGLDPSRLKILIITHGHGDHYGGARYLVAKYHVRVYMSAADYDFAELFAREVLAAGTRGPGPGFGLPAKRDLFVTDGGSITLGNETIKTYITPGHTPGSLMMLIPATENGQPHLLAYISGATNKGLSPEMHAAFTESSTRMAKVMAEAKPDGLIGAHPNYDDAVFNIEYMRANPKEANPFLIGTASVVRFINILNECNIYNAENEAKRRSASQRQPDGK